MIVDLTEEDIDQIITWYEWAEGEAATLRYRGAIGSDENRQANLKVDALLRKLGKDTYAEMEDLSK